MRNGGEVGPCAVERDGQCADIKRAGEWLGRCVKTRTACQVKNCQEDMDSTETVVPTSKLYCEVTHTWGIEIWACHKTAPVNIKDNQMTHETKAREE